MSKKKILNHRVLLVSAFAFWAVGPGSLCAAAAGGDGTVVKELVSVGQESETDTSHGVLPFYMGSQTVGLGLSAERTEGVLKTVLAASAWQYSDPAPQDHFYTASEPVSRYDLSALVYRRVAMDSWFLGSDFWLGGGLGVTYLPAFEIVHLFPYRDVFTPFRLSYPEIASRAEWGGGEPRATQVAFDLDLKLFKSKTYSVAAGEAHLEASRAVGCRWSAVVGLEAAAMNYDDLQESLQQYSYGVTAGLKMRILGK